MEGSEARALLEKAKERNRRVMNPPHPVEEEAAEREQLLRSKTLVLGYAWLILVTMNSV